MSADPIPSPTTTSPVSGEVAVFSGKESMLIALASYLRDYDPEEDDGKHRIPIGAKQLHSWLLIVQQELTPPDGPTYDGLRAAIEQSRNRNVAGGGWCLTDKQADTALEWAAFLEGIGAPCPKIAGFDEGLQLVWPGASGRHYLSLDDGTDGPFVLNVDAKGRRAALATEHGKTAP